MSETTVASTKRLTIESLREAERRIFDACPWLRRRDIRLLVSDYLPEDSPVIALTHERVVVVRQSVLDLFRRERPELAGSKAAENELASYLWWRLVENGQPNGGQR